MSWILCSKVLLYIVKQRFQGHVHKHRIRAWLSSVLFDLWHVAYLLKEQLLRWAVQILDLISYNDALIKTATRVNLRVLCLDDAFVLEFGLSKWLLFLVCTLSLLFEHGKVDLASWAWSEFGLWFFQRSRYSARVRSRCVGWINCNHVFLRGKSAHILCLSDVEEGCAALKGAWNEKYAWKTIHIVLMAM